MYEHLRCDRPEVESDLQQELECITPEDLGQIDTFSRRNRFVEEH